MLILQIVISVLDKITHHLNVIFRGIATVFLAIMLAIIVSNVTLRYLGRFGFSWAGALHWAEEVTKFLMIWLAYLILPTAHKNGLNVSVDFAVAAFKGTKFGYALRLVIEILICILLFKGLELSWSFMLQGATKYSLALHIKMIYIYAILPVSLLTTLLVSLEVLLKLLQSVIDGQNHFDPEIEIIEEL